MENQNFEIAIAMQDFTEMLRLYTEEKNDKMMT
jgi:hypothetical protein